MHSAIRRQVPGCRLTQSAAVSGNVCVSRRRWSLLLVAIEFINPDYVKPMFTHTSGLVVLTAGVVMIIMGSVAIGKIVDIEV